MDREFNSASFDIISAVGAAKSCFIEAIRLAAKGEIEEAEKILAEGEEAFIEGHKAHATILSAFAGGKNITVDVLLVHAECQMMSAEDFKTIAEELIAYRKDQA